MGFESQSCTPEHPKARRIAERFMSVLIEIIHATIVDKKDAQVELGRRFMNYKNTPHPCTGKVPSELIMGRLLRTKKVTPIKPAKGILHQEAMLQDREIVGNKGSNLDTISKFLIKQQKTTTKPPFDSKHYTVMVKVTQVKAIRGTKTRVRNIPRCKLLHIQPTHLIRQKQSLTSKKEDSAEVNTKLVHSLPRQQNEEGPKYSSYIALFCKTRKT